MSTISANVLVRNERKHVDSFVHNMLEAGIDEVIFLDGGSTDGSYERLLYWKNKYSFIHVLLWEQPQGSSYKKGFNEVARRNLMIDASSMEWCLYIDIDERIPVSFKKDVLNIINEGKQNFIAIPRYHFWSQNIRVNLSDDKVWFPDLNYRLFRRNEYVRFKSNDANGLHNYLTYKNKRVIGGFNKSGFTRLLVKWYSYYLKYMLGVHLKTSNSTCVFHFHYFDLANKKENDLRRKEFNLEIKIVSSVEEGLQYCLRDSVVPCIHISKVPRAEAVKQEYIHDISLCSNS